VWNLKVIDLMSKKKFLTTLTFIFDMAYHIQCTSCLENPLEQKLGPYELAMVSDLLIQISMYRCPAVSRPAMQSMKKFVFSSFAKAPEVGVSHPLFYSNYRSLVECLNFVDIHFPKKPLSTLSEQKRLHYIDTRRKRETINSNSDEFNNLYPGEEIRSASDKRPFELIFNDLYGIVKHSCPSEVFPNPNFLINSIKEIVEWIGKHSMAIQAEEKYFERLGLLKDMDKCFKLISTINKPQDTPLL